MRWPWPPFRRGEMIAGAVCITFGVAFLFALIKFAHLRQAPNTGFGPDWDCAYVPNSEPVCVKRLPPMRLPQHSRQIATEPRNSD